MSRNGHLRTGVLAWARRNSREFHWAMVTDLRALPPVGAARIVDLGCGAKPYERYFDGAIQYVGVDLPVDRSANKLEKRADVYARLNELPLDNGRFDVLLCTQVLEHVPDVGAVLTEAHRVLRDGGLAVVTVPFMAAEHEVPHDYLRFTSFGIRELLERAGFEQIEVKKQFGFWSAIGEMIYWHYHRKVQGTCWEKYWFAMGTTGFMRLFHLLNRVDRDDKLVLNLFVTARKPGTAARAECMR